MRPTQDQIQSAHAAYASLHDEFIGLCRETISGTRHYTREQLEAAAQAMMDARDTFQRTMAPCCGYGPMLTTLEA
jgi:hypothetical protein